jgi:hypothetical protein
MKNGQKAGSGIEHHMPSMIAGAAMIGAAVIIGMCGMITGGAAVFAAARQWLRESDMTPSEMVKHRLEQGKAAVAASAGAWQEHNGAPARRVRT